MNTYSSSPYRVSFGQPQATPYRGVYINVDRRTDRRDAMDAQIRKFGLADRYVRFSAIEGASVRTACDWMSPGATACFWSHYRALEQARAPGACAHVLEDDAVFSR